MRRAVTLFALTTALVAAGCGDSAEERAQNDVCDARADIQKQVDDLQALTPATVTADAVTASLDAIKDDLGKIKDAEDELSEQRKSDLKAANEQFSSQVSDAVSNVLSSKSVSEAKAQLQTAVSQLVDSYQQTLATYDCS